MTPSHQLQEVQPESWRHFGVVTIEAELGEIGGGVQLPR